MTLAARFWLEVVFVFVVVGSDSRSVHGDNSSSYRCNQTVDAQAAYLHLAGILLRRRRQGRPRRQPLRQLVSAPVRFGAWRSLTAPLHAISPAQHVYGVE